MHYLSSSTQLRIAYAQCTIFQLNSVQNSIRPMHYLSSSTQLRIAYTRCAIFPAYSVQKAYAQCTIFPAQHSLEQHTPSLLSFSSTQFRIAYVNWITFELIIYLYHAICQANGYLSSPSYTYTLLSFKRVAIYQAYHIYIQCYLSSVWLSFKPIIYIYKCYLLSEWLSFKPIIYIYNAIFQAPGGYLSSLSYTFKILSFKQMAIFQAYYIHIQCYLSSGWLSFKPIYIHIEQYPSCCSPYSSPLS